VVYIGFGVPASISLPRYQHVAVQGLVRMNLMPGRIRVRSIYIVPNAVSVHYRAIYSADLAALKSELNNIYSYSAFFKGRITSGQFSHSHPIIGVISPWFNLIM
jgi:hypothetical protein